MHPIFTEEQFEHLMAIIAKFQQMQRNWRRLAFTLFGTILFYAPLGGFEFYRGYWWMMAFSTLIVAMSLALLIKLAKDYRSVLHALHALTQMRDAKTREQVVFWADQYECLLINYVGPDQSNQNKERSPSP